MELVIDKKTYGFKFGTKFIREIDKQMPVKQNDMEFGIGLTARVLPELNSGNTNTLSKILELANKTEDERITLDQLDDYIDDVEDIEGLFDQVLKAIAESNAGKLASKNFKQRMAKAEKSQG